MRAHPPSTLRRIALIGPAAPWRGGIAQYLDALSAALRERGHATRIVTFSRQYPRLLFPGKEQREPGRTSRPETEALLDTLRPWTWLAAGRRLRGWAPDAVLFNYWLPLFVPVYAGVVRGLDRRRTRVVFDCHNFRPHERRPLDDLLTRWMLSLTDHYLLHSDAVRDQLTRERPGARARVSPLPLSADFPAGPGRVEARKRLGLPGDARVLLFFGFVRAYKGLDVALQALAALPPAFHLVVAGEFYDRRDRYDGLIERAGAARVHVHDDFVHTGDVGTFFDAADLVVQPYHRASQSGVLPLAWRYGVPVVASRVGGLVEHIVDGRNGYLIEPGDAIALASTIARVFEGETPERLRDGVRETRAALTWEALATVVEEMIASEAG